MKRPVIRVLFGLLTSAFLMSSACAPQQGSSVPPGAFDLAGPDCPNPPSDQDSDGISDANEGASERPPRDTDDDGTPDYRDIDSDADGIPDIAEGRNGNACRDPADADSDGVPDFRDLDSDDAADSSVRDQDERGPDAFKPLDTDGDGIPDFADNDNDGDGILDVTELAPPGSLQPVSNPSSAPDTDLDGIPDYLDTDSDGDTVGDLDDGAIDTDGDLTPNFRDLDSDADCIPDALEAGDTLVDTIPVDTDGDGAQDFEDADSDNDGLADRSEDANCSGTVDACETDPKQIDTDFDGVTDLIEKVACDVKPPAEQSVCLCDGFNAASSPLVRGDFVFVVDYMKAPVPTVETLNLSTDVSQADVVFSLDTTGSMGEELANLANGLATLVPAIKAKVANVAFGVVQFKDFGDAPITQYVHRVQTIASTAGLTSVQTALSGLTATGGGDTPEAGWLALYSIAGGPAVNVSGYNSVFPLATTPPAPATAGEIQGNVGGAGFRMGSVPIVVTVSDVEWHDAFGSQVAGDPESGRNMYGFAGTPSRRAAITRLQALNAHVVGLSAIGAMTVGDPRSRSRATAQETGAVVKPSDFGPVGVRPVGCTVAQCCTGLNGAGEAPVGGDCPLSYTVSDTGGGVTGAITSGIVALANALKFDIHVEAVNIDALTVDRFIDKLVPNLSGTGPAAVCLTTTSSPLQDNFTGPKATAGADGVLDTFPGISGGGQICFDVIPKTNVSVMNSPDPQIFRAQLLVKGIANGQTVNLGAPREVFFLVPPVIQNGPIN